MLKYARPTIAALVLLTITSTASAQVFKAAQGQTFYFDLDIRDGAFGEWRHDDLATFTAMRATLEFHRLGRHEKFLPVARIIATTADGEFGLSLVADRWRPPMRLALVQKEGWGAGSVKTIQVGEKITIEFDWGHQNTLVIRLGDGRTHELPLPSPVNSLLFSASTGELIVHSLTFGVITP